jgi:hypothetical protein
VSKLGSYRAVVTALGAIFGKGVEMPFPGDATGAVVPTNPGSVQQICYAFMTIDAAYNRAVVLTDFGAIVPDSGIPLARITVPAGNTAADLTGVTITDVRRMEPAYPTIVNTLAYASEALPFTLLDTAYSVHLDVASYAGGWNQREGVYAKEKAANGFRIYADGTLDEVNVLWKAMKMVI